MVRAGQSERQCRPEDDEYKIGFYVNNVFNQFYLLNVSTNELVTYRGPAQLRSYGVNVSFNLGRGAWCFRMPCLIHFADCFG